MCRLALAFVCALFCALVAFSAEPQTPPIERQLAVQSAMAAARKHLDAQQPSEAVAALEKELPHADGSKDFLNLLRQAYTAELALLEKTPNAPPERVAQTRRKLALLGEPAKADAPAPVVPVVPMAPAVPEPAPLGPPPVAPVVPPIEAPSKPIQPLASDNVEDAVTAFKLGKFAEADRLFTAIGATKLTAEQRTAWAYCRIKLAADRVNAPNCDATTAAGAAQDVSEALKLTNNPQLLALGNDVLKSAQAKAGNAKAPAPVVAAPAGDVVESGSFRVFHGGNRELGEAVAKAAEASRKHIFERWSGPPGGAWQPKCDIVLHASADAYAKTTGKPAALTGHATVKLTDGRAAARRIDLRAEEGMTANALPRELTHVVLADMFAKDPPPKWAQEGMAILACSPEEVGRYTRTLPRCARDGELRTFGALFDLKDFPADKITGYYCQSVSVTEYLVSLRGEKNFKIFLGDVQRYGIAQALKRQYDIDGPQALERDWKRACLDQAR